MHKFTDAGDQDILSLGDLSLGEHSAVGGQSRQGQGSCFSICQVFRRLEEVFLLRNKVFRKDAWEGGSRFAC